MSFGCRLVGTHNIRIDEVVDIHCRKDGQALLYLSVFAQSGRKTADALLLDVLYFDRGYVHAASQAAAHGG